MPELRPAVERETRARLDVAAADAFLTRLDQLSFDILEPLGQVYGAVTDPEKLATELVLDALNAAAQRPVAAAAARPPPRNRSRLVPAVPDDRLRLLRRPLRRVAAWGPRAPGLPGRAGCHLPAPDAAAAAARGGERRRLRGGGLRRHRSAPGHHGRLAGPGRRPAPARHGAVRRSGGQPHRGRARVGPPGAGRRARLPRDVPDLPGPDRTRPLRAHAARGVPGHRPREASPR